MVILTICEFKSREKLRRAGGEKGLLIIGKRGAFAESNLLFCKQNASLKTLTSRFQ